MSLSYRPPSVTITEEVSPQISSSLAAPAVPCLVGVTQGSQTRTSLFTLSGTSAVAIPNLPAGAKLSSVVSVVNAFNPSAGTNADGSYVLTTDYTVQLSAGTVTRVGAGGIPDGAQVYLTFTYVPSDYYEPRYFTDLSAIEERYGNAYATDANGVATGISSVVSYAAGLVFENGAAGVYIAPLFKLTTANDPDSQKIQPNATEAAASATWRTTLANLQTFEDINLITPVVGQSDANVGDSSLLAIFQEVQDHLRNMQNQNQYVVAVFGEDRSASSTVATPATIRQHAVTLSGRLGGLVSEQIAFLSPAKFSKSLNTSGASVVVGGQYFAAAYMGAIASRSVSQAMTRQFISGFNSILDPRKLTDKNLDASAGLTVLEQKGQNIIVRHAITLDNSSAARRELSVVRAKHRMIESIRDTIDDQIIGKIIADGNAAPTVEATITSILNSLRQTKDIVDYNAVSARLLVLDPTTIEVRFSYRPAFPVNYVNVTFSIDLTSGDTTATTTA